jgi:hypothetical protein
MGYTRHLKTEHSKEHWQEYHVRAVIEFGSPEAVRRMCKDYGFDYSNGRAFLDGKILSPDDIITKKGNNTTSRRVALEKKAPAKKEAKAEAPAVETRKVNFCPFCGENMNVNTNAIRFCYSCGEALPEV